MGILQNQITIYSEFIGTIDSVILGRKTYDWVMKNGKEFPHSNKDTYVITKTPRQKTDNIKFYSGNLKELVLKLKQAEGKNIFIDGGAEIVNELLKEKLIDRFYISIVPVLLGGGIRLFNGSFPEQNLKLKSSMQFETGLIQLYYELEDRQKNV